MIQARDVTVRFSRGAGRKLNALDGLNLSVNQGDFFALVGPNGAGKSTALYCFLGLLRPTSGQVTLMGHPPARGAPINRYIGYLPEEPHYHLYLTIEEAIQFYGSLYGERVSETKINLILDRLDLLEFKDLRLDRCSKGMKQKLGFAQCIIQNPRLLFLDEPTRGLDPLIVRVIRDILKDLHQKGTTIIMNSHVLSEVEMVATRVAILDKGKVLIEEELKNLVKMDCEEYEVEFERMHPLPTYVTKLGQNDSTVRGLIPIREFYKFISVIKKKDKKLISCSLRKRSLEESVIDHLKRNKNG